MNRKEDQRRMIANTSGRFDQNWTPSDPNVNAAEQHSNGVCNNRWWGCKRREMNDRWNQMQAPTHIPQTSQPYEARTQGGKGWNGTDDVVPASTSGAATSRVDVQDVAHDRNRDIHVDVKVAASDKIKEAGRQASDAVCVNSHSLPNVSS
jgi:hypothetical protein